MIVARSIALAWSEHAGHDCLRVLGRSSELAAAVRRFAVVPTGVLDAGGTLRAMQPLAGRIEVVDDGLCFVPRWPFVPALDYALLERGPSGAYHVVAALSRPAPEATPTTEVLAISPTSPVVPLNLLKLYVYFSSPMSEGGAARAVTVRRADTGEPLADVFLPHSLELWDPARTRLTLLLDPGRIKRGLLPHEQLGYPLIEGVPITVCVDAAFRDAAGLQLRGAAERGYEVGPALRSRVDPNAWRVQPPVAGSRDPLTIMFDRPLDRALLTNETIVIDDAEGTRVSGATAVAPSDQTWHFTPNNTWRPATYTLKVASHLEDLAGNSVARVFDRDLTRLEDTPFDGDSVRIEFAVEQRA